MSCRPSQALTWPRICAWFTRSSSVLETGPDAGLAALVFEHDQAGVEPGRAGDRAGRPCRTSRTSRTLRPLLTGWPCRSGANVDRGCAGRPLAADPERLRGEESRACREGE